MAGLLFVFVVLGISLLYLGHPNQAWLRAPLNRRVARSGASLAFVAALVCGWTAYSALTLVLSALAVAMLAGMVWPFIALSRA